MKEIWKDIEGYEGLYQISNLGNVKSLERIVHKSNGVIQTRKERIMAKRVNTDGYYIAKLNVDKKSKSIAIHILVAKHFVPNPLNLPEVNHLDCNRKNNVYTNLCWTTHQENVQYSASKGHYKHYGSSNPNYRVEKLKQFYKENPEEAKKLGRKGGQNGKARKVIIFSDSFEKEFSCIKYCSEYLIQEYSLPYKISTVNKKITRSIKNKVQFNGLNFRFA